MIVSIGISYILPTMLIGLALWWLHNAWRAWMVAPPKIKKMKIGDSLSVNWPDDSFHEHRGGYRESAKKKE